MFQIDRFVGSMIFAHLAVIWEKELMIFPAKYCTVQVTGIAGLPQSAAISEFTFILELV